MTDFVFPSKTVVPVTGSFAEHINRNPPSANPGVDYGFSRGTVLVAPAAGVLTAFDESTSGSGGRMSGLNCDNGYGFDFLHLSRLLGSPGQHVEQGQAIAISGASAWGSETGVAPHCHISFRQNHRHYVNSGNLDFELYRAGFAGLPGSPSTPNQGEEEMSYGLTLTKQDNTWLPGVPAGQSFIGLGTDPLVWVTNPGPEMVNGVVFAPWDAKSIAERIGQVGLRGSAGDLDKVYKSMADAKAKNPLYLVGRAV